MTRAKLDPNDPAVAQVKAFVAYLRATRLRAGISQESLGYKMYPLRAVSDAQSLISEWETGVSMPEAVSLVRWAWALGVEVELH